MAPENKRRRILVFSLAYEPFIGGAEVAVKEVISRLPQFEFKIVSADITRFWSKYLFPFWGANQGRLMHEAEKFDLVWVIMANQAGIAAAWFKNCYPRVPLVLTLQEGDDLNSFAYRMRLLAPRAAGVFKKPDELTAISNYLAKWARVMGARAPVTVIPNGVDLEKLSAHSVAVRRTRQNAGAFGGKVIITTSRLVRKNGVDILIEAMRYLPPNVRLRIVGDGPERSTLEQLSSTLGVAKRVEFAGSISPAAIASELEGAQVFARPSRSEGLGNSFLEAMAAGLPTIGTPVGGIPDFLVEGETGWLCRPEDPVHLAEKIKFILDPTNAVLVRQVVERASKLVQERYDWAKIAGHYELVFRRLIG